MVTNLDKAGLVSFETSTERTLEDRFAEKVNVRDFGAKGDGVTDDSDAIKLAIDRCIDLWESNGLEPSNPAVLYFPPGRYDCGNTQFTVKPSLSEGGLARRGPALTTICGDGPAVSIIQNGGFLFWTTAGRNAEIFNLGFYRPRTGSDTDNEGTLDTTTMQNYGGIASIVPWTNNTVPPTAIEISSFARRVSLHNIKIDGYEWGIRDTSRGSAGTQLFWNLDIRGCGTAIYCGSIEMYLRNFYIVQNDTCGIHINADRVGSRIENCQISDGEIHSSGRGLVIEQLNTDYRKLGRYTPDYLPPTSSGWSYADGTWTGLDGNGNEFSTTTAPIIPIVFNTRLSQLCLSACTSTKYSLKAIRKVTAGTYTYDGDSNTEWAELEFYSQFPAGKYANVEGEGFANGESFSVQGVLSVPSENKIVIAKAYTSVIPDGYTEGETLDINTSYVMKGEDLIIGPGCWEGAVDNCRINNCEIDSVKDWRFTDCRLKSGFWMDATVLPCEGISFFGNRQAIMQGRWVDCPTAWDDNPDYAAQTVPGGDRVISGPGSTSGWASVELMGSTNDPAKGLSEPKLVMVMPKEGGTTDPTGRPLEFSGVTVSPDGIQMTGLPTSEPTLVGGIWNSGGTLKIKTS
tara:strand:- start:337 stop:2220 length:1884 start_codon:yes stop_codon:yes gene_type:complete